jgi:4-carboxymuconolactone decarboxylase
MKEKSRYEKGLEVACGIWGKESVEESLNRLRKLHPDFKRFAVEFVYGDIYGRPNLDSKTRILCTISALAALGKEVQLKVNIDKALKAGISKDEILEVCLHILVYAGFPASWNALAVAQEVFAKQS